MKHLHIVSRPALAKDDIWHIIDAMNMLVALFATIVPPLFDSLMRTKYEA